MSINLKSYPKFDELSVGSIVDVEYEDGFTINGTVTEIVGERLGVELSMAALAEEPAFEGMTTVEVFVEKDGKVVNFHNPETIIRTLLEGVEA